MQNTEENIISAAEIAKADPEHYVKEMKEKLKRNDFLSSEDALFVDPLFYETYPGYVPGWIKKTAIDNAIRRAYLPLDDNLKIYKETSNLILMRREANLDSEIRQANVMRSRLASGVRLKTETIKIQKYENI